MTKHNSHMTKHCEQSDSVLTKSLVPFHGQVDKALKSISHWLVSLLAPLLNTGNFSSISNRGKLACSSRIEALPPGQSAPSVCLSKSWLTSCLMNQVQMGHSQIVAAYNVRQSESQVELSRILVSLEFECFLEKMAVVSVKRQ